MSQLPTPTPTSSVQRTMRAAIKLGDDYVTIEDVITLPPGASDEQIQQAIATGLRMYEAQRAAVEAQIRELREGAPVQAMQMRDPDGPASEKQRQYMDYLLKELRWNQEQLAEFAAERRLNPLTLTKREASDLIDQLKGVLAGAAGQAQDQGAAEQDQGNAESDTQQAQRPIPVAERATQRQIRALERLVDERGIDLESELRQRFGDRQLADLSMDEAGQLLSEWQQRPRRVVQAAK